ncbi:hypothetical protein PIB30_013274, partial [Stylosanthes scabra]|nr:hypothetical protein [Stylosanthes scabra]
ARTVTQLGEARTTTSNETELRQRWKSGSNKDAELKGAIERVRKETLTGWTTSEDATSTDRGG